MIKILDVVIIMKRRELGGYSEMFANIPRLKKKHVHP